MAVENNEQALEDLRSKIIASMGKNEGSKESNKRTAGLNNEMHPSKKHRAMELPRGPRNVQQPNHQPNRYSGDHSRATIRNERSRYQSQSRRPPSRPPSRPHGRYQGNSRQNSVSYTSMPLKFREEDLKDVVPINERRRSGTTKWDLTPKGFENVPAERAKLSGLFPQPGKPQELDREKLKRVAADGGNENRRTRILFEDSRSNNLIFSELACKLIVAGISVPSLEEARQRLGSFVSGLEGDHKLKGVVQSSNYLVLEFSDAVCTTIVLSCKSFISELFGWSKCHWRRPHEYVQQLDNAERLCGPDIVALERFPVPDEESVEKKLAELGIKTRFLKPICVNDNSQVKQFTGCVLLELEENTSELSGLEWFFPNESFMTQKTSTMTFHGLPKVVIEPVRVPSRVLLLMNLVDPLDLKLEKFAEEVESTLEASLENVEGLRMKRPNVDFRLNFDHFREGVGNIYVKFQDVKSAKRALEWLSLRNFNGRSVLCCYVDESDFEISGVL